MSERVAILVIHGIGRQQPYQTLDQFTRNLFISLNAANPGWKVEPLLDQPPDPTGQDNAWTRVSYRLLPPPGSHPVFRSDRSVEIEDITLFEYYWAPLTQDKITYTGSLSFLIQAGLKPFLYLASNLNALGQVEGEKRFFFIILKELWRQASFFLPLLLLLGALLWGLQTAALGALVKDIKVDGILLVSAILLGIRYLYMWTSYCAFKASFLATPTGWQRKPLWRAALVAGVLLNLFAWPFALSPLVRLVALLGSALARSLPALVRLGHWSTHLRAFAKAVHFPWHHPVSLAGAKSFFLLNPALSTCGHTFLILLLAWLTRFILVDYVGDVAVYVNNSQCSKTYAARTRILNECSAVLSRILTARNQSGPAVGEPLFDRVLIAAHSLGSVIAYDTINALLNRARTADRSDRATLQPRDLEKLRGLLTFGSPLNKIFYFFREQDEPKYALRQQSLNLLYGFRLNRTLTHPVPAPPFYPNPDFRWHEADAALALNFRWINAYSLFDPISGKIVFYKADTQRLFHYWKPFVAHLEYWEDPKLYTFFRENLL